MAVVLSFGMGCIVFPQTALMVLASPSPDHGMWVVAAVLTIVPVWVGTLAVGCLVRIPVGIGRMVKRFARRGAEAGLPRGRIWDQWMDGPERQ
jgi:hypothetical protein